MIVERDVFQAKYGQGDELVEVLKASRSMWEARGLRHRILTDLTGPFFTVVLEIEWPDEVPLQIAHEALFAKEEFGDWFGRTIEFAESGHRELFIVVE